MDGFSRHCLEGMRRRAGKCRGLTGFLEDGDVGKKERRRPSRRRLDSAGDYLSAMRALQLIGSRVLERGFDFKAPGFQQRFRNVLGVPVTASPFTKPGGTDVLIRCQFELLDNLLEGGDSGHNGPDGLRLAPVWITTTLCHRFLS